MKFSEFKEGINLYCRYTESLTPEQLEGLLEYLQKDISLEKDISFEELKKFDREYNYFINKWSNKYPEEMSELAKKLEIEVPVSSAIYEAVYTDITPRELLDKLMNRKLKEEERYV